MYATVANMIERFGETQIIRLSRPEDHAAVTVDATKVDTAIGDASAVIDSYIRGRYTVPIATPPAEIIRAACTLARYDLAQGENTDPSEEMAKSRKEVMDWLMGISKGHIHLEVPASSAAPTGSGAQTSDRTSLFNTDSLRDW